MNAWKFLPLFRQSSVKLLCLVLLTCAFYFPALHAGFVWDDFFIFVNDPLMTAPEGLWRIWFDPGTERWNYWPMSRSAFWLQRQLWGLNPLGYHLVNLSLHLLVSLALWLALQTLQIRGAWWVALLFALHPAHVVSVAWVTELKNTLSGLFYLLSFWSFFRFDRNRKWQWYGLSLFLFLIALLSKSSLVMFPALLVVYQLGFSKKRKIPDNYYLMPFFILALVSGLLSVWVENQYIGLKTSGFASGILEKTIIASHAAFFYIEKLLWPHSYMAVYPKWEIDLKQFHLYLPLLCWLIAAVILFLKYKAWGRPLLLGAAAFALSLFPVLGFFNVAGFSITYVWLHLVYLPSIPIFILIVQGGIWISDHFQRKKSHLMRSLPGGSIVLIVLILGTLTWYQSRLYKNEETLWSDTLRKNPSSWMAFHHLGNVFLDQGKFEEALQMFNQEIRNNPNASQGYASRALAYSRLKRYDLAVESFNFAIRLRSDLSRYYRDRGLVFFFMNKKESMCADWKHACRLGDCRNYRLAQNRNDCL
ncbi:MAG: tetratricopeptide repeat protein [SAR324 cluster bacterium]|nr:tetratricopeptide repeat protein [SAR324 cluster bacterium]